MRWFDLRHLKSVSLMVGAGALAVVLAMNSEVHAHQKKHHHKKHHQMSSDHVALTAKKLDEVLLAINALPPGGALPCGAATEGNRFVVSTDGTKVCDNTTGLTWEQMPDSILRQWQAAIDFCPTLGTGYRLPEVKELISLVDFGQSNPALPADHPFSNVLDIYWSATPAADLPLDACSVVFLNGVMNQSFKSNTHNVWCVRDGP